MLQRWLFLFAVVLFAKESCGFCIRGLSQRTPDGEPFCSYHGYTMKNWETKVIPAPQCMRCMCTSSGFSCCSYGYAMMLHSFNQLPSNTRCRPVADGCEIKWVYRNDETRECPVLSGTNDERFMMDDIPRPMI